MAFITLIERKILGYSQLRLGPNKPSILGLLQPAADAIKLFSNKSVIPKIVYGQYFNIIPFGRLALILIVWILRPCFFARISFSFRFILLLVLFRFSVYPVLLAGWSSNSKFSGLGAIRNVAQTISYEVSLALVISIILIDFRVIRLSEKIRPLLRLILFPSILLIWLIIIIAETNRTPFDFSEGERELVSGFNTEYSRNKFAVVFMAEYASIYFLASLSRILYLTGLRLILPLITVGLIFFWVWIRATLPRHRYDYLIDLNWKKILPVVILFLFFRRVLYLVYNKI